MSGQTWIPVLASWSPPDAKSLEGHYHDLAEIIPDGVEDGQFHAVHERPMYDFRITVEAVPVEDKR